MALRQLPLRPVLLSLVTSVALLLAPSVASAAWTVPPTPIVGGADERAFSGVDCSSANSCFAVGFAELPGFREPPRRRWPSTGTAPAGSSCRPRIPPAQPGARWTASRVRGRRSASQWAIGERSRIHRLSRRGSRDRSSSSGTGQAGRSSRPGPDSARSRTSPAPGCSPAPRSGASLARTPATTTLAERWDGTGWHVQSTPNLAGRAHLFDVSCPGRRTCTAVGDRLSMRPGAISLPRRALVGRVNSWG